MKACFSLLLCLGVAVACEQDRGSSNPRPKPQSGDGGGPAPSGSLDGHEFYELGPAQLQLADQGVSGVGALLFANSLPATHSIKRFSIGFSLEDGASISLVSFSDAALELGVKVGFERAGNALRIVAGESLAALPGVSAQAETITLFVDVDNRIESPRVVVRSSSAPSVLWDSALAPVVLTQGRGDRWGLVLNGSVVRTVDLVRPGSYTVADLHQAALKASSRFERLAIPGSAFRSVKTWTSNDDVWAKLTYIVETRDGPATEAFLFLACHFHGAELGCHKKDGSDPSEPADEAPIDDGLPPIDEDLPEL